MTFLRAGDGVMAEQLCREALEDFPDEPNFLSVLGAALNCQGRAVEAEHCLRRALDEQPDYAKAHEQLGRSLLAQGRAADAVEHLRRAVELDPKLESAQLALGRALGASGKREEADEIVRSYVKADPLRELLARAAEHHRAGRDEEAEQLYREILRREPRNVEALRLLGLLAAKAEHYGQAELLLKRAVEIAPDFVPAWLELSHAQIERLDLAAALASAQRAVALNSGVPNTWINLANALARCGRQDEAIESYRKAIALRPEQAGGYLGLGNVLKTVGRQAEAVAAYRKGIELRPGFAELYWSLSNLKTFRFDDAEIEQMERQLETPAASEETAVFLGFALGKAYEDRGDYALAFRMFERANAARRMQEHYDPVQTEVLTDRIIDVFDSELRERCADLGHPDPAPIFIVGLPRSGSTLIEQILSSHSQVDATHELPEVGRLIRQINQKAGGGTSYPEAVRSFEAETWAALGRSYIESTRMHRGDAPYFIDKMPNNFACIGLLQLILPHAKFINARRHPLATCLSCYKQLFARGQPFTYDLFELGEYYLQYERMMRHWYDLLPGRILDVDYEQVVGDHAGQTRRLLEFCGLPWEEACLRFHQTERAIRTASSEQVRQPIYTSAVGVWRHYAAQLAPLIEMLEPVIAERGGS